MSVFSLQIRARHAVQMGGKAKGVTAELEKKGGKAINIDFIAKADFLLI